MKRLILIIPILVYTLTAAAYIATIVDPFIKRFSASKTTTASLIQNAILEPITPLSAINQINQFRKEQNLLPLENNENICQEDGEAVFDVCEQCTHAALIKINEKTPDNAFIASIKSDSATQSMINNPKLTHICATNKGEHLTMVLARIATKSEEFNTTQKSIPPSQSAPKNFSEGELWEGLMSYRNSHQVKSLEKDELLCEYARKRVADHIYMYENVSKSEYPVPDKYPLDAHSGFIKDADSGFAFDVTQKNVLAENLAYWPGVEYAHQVIEWGWDSSTEGHRETQLSNDYNRACISGHNGFYVAIFSN